MLKNVKYKKIVGIGHRKITTPHPLANSYLENLPGAGDGDVPRPVEIVKKNFTHLNCENVSRNFWSEPYVKGKDPREIKLVLQHVVLFPKLFDFRIALW